MVEEVSEDIINQNWNTTGAKRHFQVFKVAHGCVEGCLLLISLPNPDQMVSIPNV